MPRLIPHDGLDGPQRYLAIMVVSCATILTAMDSTLVNIALPTIMGELNVSAASSVLIINASQIAMLVCLLPLSALGALIGYRKVYLGGLVFFSAACVGCALSQTLEQIVVARAFQGIGAAGACHGNSYARCGLGNGNADKGKAGSWIGKFRVTEPLWNRDDDFRQDFVVLERGCKQPLKEIVAGDAPLVGLERSAERRHGGGIVGRRVVVGQGTADRAAIAHLGIADAFGDMSEPWDRRDYVRRFDDLGMCSHCSDDERIALSDDRVEPGHAIEVDDA